MPLKPEVLDRLLLSKSFLDKMRFQPVAVHDRHTLAQNIIGAHDAAELAIAAICDHLGCLPQKGNSYLMDYFEPLKQHLSLEPHARDYFRNLNVARNGIKHQGLFPDAKQWSRVGESVFQHVTKWCWDYLKESFVELDESALIVDADVKRLYDEAKANYLGSNYKTALEDLSLALALVFDRNPALRGFAAGDAKTEDAIRLAGFGVHGNDFLALQQFLPFATNSEQREMLWKQSRYGHPGNWTEQNVAFCLRTFVDVAVKIQGAQWVPGPLERIILYEQQVEALKDGVEVWTYVPKDRSGKILKGLESLLATERHKEVIKTLRRGERFKATVFLASENPENPLAGPAKSKDVLFIAPADKLDWIGNVLLADVKVTCVPRASEYVKKYFPSLPEVDWQPE